jgi:hypothetical protein
VGQAQGRAPTQKHYLKSYSLAASKINSLLGLD